jgi:hypothetical protein
MNKIIPILIVVIFVLSGLGAVAGSVKNDGDLILDKIEFSNPSLIDNDNYISIDMKDSTSDTWELGRPKIPLLNKVYTFPFGTKINNVEVSFSEPIVQNLDKYVVPSPIPQMRNGIVNSISNSHEAYSQIDIYPDAKFSYTTNSGLKNGERVIYLNLNFAPIQYKPNENQIYFTENVEYKIQYENPVNPISVTDMYDILIITPSEFENTLQRFIDHKEVKGFTIKLTTLDDIPSGVGDDVQEDIKYYIKDAIDNWDINYLILVGSGVKDAELFPVRYAHIPSGSYESSFPSDLYYADIYDGSMAFSDWDADDDGKYGEFPQDISNMDIIPDVKLGKIPCNNKKELNNYIDKVIWYDTHNKMTNEIVQWGGDTFPGDIQNVYEGEYMSEKVMEILPGYSTTQLWGSNNKLTKINCALGFRSSADFVDTSGHGSPVSWATHPPEDDQVWIPPKFLLSYYRGWLYVDFDLFLVKNSKKYPIIFYNACSNNKYSESETCLGWKSLLHKNGGGIITFAASGIGYGAHGTAESERLFGWMEINTFKELYTTKELGETWVNSVTDYYLAFQAQANDADYKTLCEYSMFGDPTLSASDGDDPIHLPPPRIIPRLWEFLSERFPIFNKIINLLF